MIAINEFWREYYGEVFARNTSYLDFSNETVQIQTFASVLDAMGHVSGARCLDIGCGRGHMSRILDGLGAARICALDFQAAGIEELRRTAPRIEGRVMAAEALQFATFGATFDRILMIEVLEYLDFSAMLRTIWPLLEPGGRLIAVTPNADNDIVGRVQRRFEGRYRALSQAQILAGLAELPNVACVRLRGLTFGEDQTICAYRAGDWTEALEHPRLANRLAFVAVKAPR